MINKSEYGRRRKSLMAQMTPNSIAIVPAGQEQTRSRDTDYPFRQDSDFMYLSGFNEPDALLVLLPGREQGEFIMFCRERDREREIWDGYRAGPAGACTHFGADEAFPINDIDDILPDLIEGRERVYYAIGLDMELDSHVMGWMNALRAKVRTGARAPTEFSDIGRLLHEMRLIKSAAELRVMARAGEISAAAHCRAMTYCQPGMLEYQLEAEILHEFHREGARAAAYNSIVGGGANGCILHYTENNARLGDGDLVLIDAGCEFEGYAGDITRTFPVNGRFTPEQRALYDVVLNAQTVAINCVRPGNHWNDPHEAAVEVITAGLVELGLLNGSVDDLIEQQAYKPFYMHRTGHWLGMDVHDVGDYKIDGRWRVLEPGMVMTVEPGIYVSPDNTDVAAKWRGIGIRIEDDVVVSENGCDILTRGVPKDADEIEALMKAGAGRKPAGGSKAG